MMMPVMLHLQMIYFIALFATAETDRKHWKGKSWLDELTSIPKHKLARYLCRFSCVTKINL